MLLERESYNIGDLVLIDDAKGFVEIVVVLNPTTLKGPHGSMKFYKIFSITHGVSYTIPESLIKGLLCV